MNPGLIDLDALVLEASKLEPLPPSATRLAGLVADPERDLLDVADAIRFDQALTGRVLGAANAVSAGGRVEVSTIEEAVRRLGSGRVLSIALSGSVGRAMRRALPEYGLGEGELWTHSVAAALAVERAARYIRRTVRPEAFAAALLHDVGKLVLARHLRPEAIASIRLIQRDDGLVSDDAEIAVLAVGHARLGACVARHWGLPESIALGIEHHHSPLSGPDEASRILCSQIRLADAVASTLGHSSGEAQGTGFSPALAGSLGISLGGFEELCRDVEWRLDDVLEAYGD